jgi:hypothetical protein
MPFNPLIQSQFIAAQNAAAALGFANMNPAINQNDLMQG